MCRLDSSYLLKRPNKGLRNPGFNGGFLSDRLVVDSVWQDVLHTTGGIFNLWVVGGGCKKLVGPKMQFSCN